MIDSYSKVDKRLLFREVFNDEASVRKNGGVPATGSVFNNDGTWSKVGVAISLTYPNFVSNNAKSIRVKFYCPDISSAIRLVIDGRSLTFFTPWACSINLAANMQIGTGGFTGALIYNNGVNTSSVNIGWNEVVVTGFTLIKKLTIGCTGGGGLPFENLKVDFIEIYNEVLTASEVYNLYNDLTYKSLQTPMLMDLNAYQGSIINNVQGATAITNVGVKVVQNDGINVMDFDGVTSYLQMPTYSELLGDLTFDVVFKASEQAIRGILVGTKLRLNTWVNGNLLLSSNSTINYHITTNTNNYRKSRWVRLTYTRAANGTTFLYVNGKVLGTSQNSGTPEANTGNFVVGAYNNLSSKLKGTIASIKIFPRLLTANEIMQLHTSSIERRLI